ncbi:integrase, catalytic region, zinc finger, CCHC-type containing protein [Tanacetum coccineum]
MSDSEDFTVTYTEAPPSPDYVLGPEEPEQAPPLPKFIPEPIYPEFMPPEDEVFPAEEQPLPTVVSPTSDSPGYIADSDPKEDPEEDPVDYPADGGDDDDDDDDEDDDDDVEEDEDDDDKEEEEHPAPADFIDRLLAILSPPTSPLSRLSSPLPQILSPPLLVSSPVPLSPLPQPASPTYPLGYRAAMIRLRAESPSTSHPLPLPSPIAPPSGTPPLLPIPLPTLSPPLLLPSTDRRAGVSEVTLPPRKRLCIALGLRYEVGESSSAPTARPTGGFRADYRFVGTLDDEIRRDPERYVDIVMSDSEDSTVTYTKVSSPFEDLPDIGSLGVDRLPMIPKDPYAYVVAAFQAPPSSDYVPGLEEQKQAPPSLKFVPERVYPEFMPPEDKEDPEEDPADYPTDGGDDDDDDDESSDDDEDDDDDVEEEDEDEEEEEHSAPADSIPPLVHRVTAKMSIRDQPPIPFLSEVEIDRFLAIPSPLPSPLSRLSSPLPQIPSPPLPVSSPVLVSPLPLPASPTYPLGYRALYRSGLVYCSGGLSGKYIVLAVCQIVNCPSGFSFLTAVCLIRQRNERALHLGPERPRVYSDLLPKDKDRYNADIRATNILFQGLPKDIYTLINHYTDAKDIWDNVKMLLEGSELTKEDRESQLYDDFEHFRQNKGETIHDYYVRFAKRINDMRNIKMTMSRMQLNLKFVNNMLPEWGRFITAVKLNRGPRDSNYDQLYAYLKQHEAHANENKMILD